MSHHGLRIARWQIWGGRRPLRRRSRHQAREVGWWGRFVAVARWAGLGRAIVVALAIAVGAVVSAWPSAARADTPSSEVPAPRLPPNYPDSLRPFLEHLEHDGCVGDDEAALLPFQRAWAYDRSKLKVCAKSRRVGITWATAYEAVEVAASQKAAGGMDVWYMANAQDDAQDFIRDCEKWVRWLLPFWTELSSASKVAEEVIKDPDKDILAYTIRFSSGFRIRALTSKPRRLRGKQGYAILDEAAHHDDLGAWMKAAGAFLYRGGRVAVISTYNGIENDFHDLVQETRAKVLRARATGQQPRAVVHEIDIYRAIREGVYRRICQSDLMIPWTAEGEAEWLADLRDFHGEDVFAEEFECIPLSSGGSYIPQHIIHARMKLGAEECPVIEFKPSVSLDKSTWGRGVESWDDVPVAQREREMRRWLDTHVGPHLKKLAEVDLYGGVDFGRRANLTVLKLLSLKQDMTRRARLVIELDRVPHAQQDQVLDYVWERCKRVRKVCLDAKGLGSAPAEHARDVLGHRAEMVDLSERWYAEHWPPLKQRFEDGAIELPKHEPLFSDLRGLRRVGGKVVIGAERTSKGQERHGDGAVALLLAEAAVGSKAEAANTSPAARYGIGARKRR